MKEEKLEQALNEVSDRHLEEAIKKNHRRRVLPWVGTVAAVLALVFIFHTVKIPVFIHAKAVAEASPSRISRYPRSEDYGEDLDAWRAATDRFDAEREARQRLRTTALSAGTDFFLESTQKYLDNAGSENRVWSPVNGYVALAALAESTGGDTRQEILDLLHTDSVESLRQQVSALWENTYQEDGKEISKISSSLWLDDGIPYNQETADRIAHDHYASVYQGDLGSSKTQKDIKNWVKRETGGILDQRADHISFPQDTQIPLVLASTVFIQSKWVYGHEFSESQNKDGIFHSPDGDVTCTYMNKHEEEGYYFWGDSFGAVTQMLSNGCILWLILPDEDKAPEDVLHEGQYFDMITRPDFYSDMPNSKYMKINLSLPRLDIESGCDMKEALQAMGVEKVFQPDNADFSPLVASDLPVWVDSVQQAARVCVDEKGVTAGSYLVLPGAGAMAPPEEVIDFVLDRPFLFAITRNGVPMFTGLVNQP